MTFHESDLRVARYLLGNLRSAAQPEAALILLGVIYAHAMLLATRVGFLTK